MRVCFSQLCINLTNESLHNLFIEHVFKLEQETYIREEVEWHFVEYEDNQHVLDLIQKRVWLVHTPHPLRMSSPSESSVASTHLSAACAGPVCILGMLDEGCTMASATDNSICMNFHNTFKDEKLHKARARPSFDPTVCFVCAH